MNNNDLTPIETRYKGYRFRSRLEARWAVYFDSMGLKWEYEPESFKLSDGSVYLPDFYFPDGWGEPDDWWYCNYAEVKPAIPDIGTGFTAEIEKSLSKYKLFSLQSGIECVLLDGPPRAIAYYCYKKVKVLNNTPGWTSQRFCYDRKLNTINMLYASRYDNERQAEKVSLLKNAIHAARSARFGAHE